MLIASEPTIDLPLANRSLRQKLDLFHHLPDALGFGWEREPQDWSFEILKKREERITRGDATWIPIEDASKRLESSIRADARSMQI